MKKHSNEDNGCTWYYEYMKEENVALGAVGRCGSDSGWLQGEGGIPTQTCWTGRGVLQEPSRKQKVIVLRATFFTFVPLPQERRLEWVGMLGEGGERRLQTCPQILLWLGEL